MMAKIAKLTPRFVLLGMILAFGACAEEEAPPPVVEEEQGPTPEELLAAAVQTLNSTSSFHFTLQLENRTIALDEAGMLSYTAVEGDVVAPDRLRAQTLVRTPVGNTEVSFVGIGPQQWLTNPLTRQWEAAPQGAAGAVASMFDPTTGIGATLAQMDSVQLVGEEALEGAQVNHLRGTLPGSVLAGFAADLAAVPRLEIDLLAGVDDNRIRRIIVTQPEANGVRPTWTFNFSDFDQPVSIEPPL